MDAKEFILFFRRLIDKDMTPFIANMENLGVTNKKPHEWAEILIAWLELSSEEDAKRYYGEYYD